MAEEIELKLRLTPADLRRLRDGGALARWACGPPVDKHLESTYYDTPDLALWRRGMALRVRRDGVRRVQTLKVPPIDAAAGDRGLQRLTEHEAELAGDGPDLTLVDDAGLRHMVAEEDLAARLRPTFATVFDRRVVPIADGDARIEAALDDGRITADGHTELLAEVEFELQTGTPGRLYALALELLQSVRFRLEPRSKASRGYALAAGRPVWSPVSEWPDLDPAIPVAEAVPRLIRGALPPLRDPDAAAPGAVDEAMTRLAAVITGFRPWLAAEMSAAADEELARFEGAMASARAWCRLQTGVHDDDATATSLRRETEAAWAEAVAALTDRDTVAFLLRLQLWLTEGTWCSAAGQDAVQDVAPGILTCAAGRLRALGPPRGGDTAEVRERRARGAAQARALAEGLPHPEAVVDRDVLRQLDAAAAAVRDLAAGAEYLRSAHRARLAGLEPQVRERLATEQRRLAEVFAEQAPEAGA